MQRQLKATAFVCSKTQPVFKIILYEMMAQSKLLRYKTRLLYCSKTSGHWTNDASSQRNTAIIMPMLPDMPLHRFEKHMKLHVNAELTDSSKALFYSQKKTLKPDCFDSLAQHLGKVLCRSGVMYSALTCIASMPAHRSQGIIFSSEIANIGTFSSKRPAMHKCSPNVSHEASNLCILHSYSKWYARF